MSNEAVVAAAATDDVEVSFLVRLRSHPNDDDLRLVYADWLEEHGHSIKSEFLRLQASLRARSSGPDGASNVDKDMQFEIDSTRLRELAERVNQDWRMLVARAPIENCSGARFDFVCPKRWDALEPTELGDDVRYCKGCRKNVHYSRTLPEAWDHARQGRCVVVDLVQLRRPGDLAAGLQPATAPFNMPDIPMPAGGIAPPRDWPDPLVPQVPQVPPVVSPPLIEQQQQQQEQQQQPEQEPPKPGPQPGFFGRLKALFQR